MFCGVCQREGYFDESGEQWKRCCAGCNLPMEQCDCARLHWWEGLIQAAGFAPPARKRTAGRVTWLTQEHSEVGLTGAV